MVSRIVPPWKMASASASASALAPRYEDGSRPLIDLDQGDDAVRRAFFRQGTPVTHGGGNHASARRAWRTIPQYQASHAESGARFVDSSASRQVARASSSWFSIGAF